MLTYTRNTYYRPEMLRQIWQLRDTSRVMTTRPKQTGTSSTYTYMSVMNISYDVQRPSKANIKTQENTQETTTPTSPFSAAMPSHTRPFYRNEKVPTRITSNHIVPTHRSADCHRTRRNRSRHRGRTQCANSSIVSDSSCRTPMSASVVLP